ncbi:Putative 3-methyladenine DNA glycosylase [bacterium HR18]|uniref:Putative 3-methyladenine DNA glycosylase n=1 Tax=Rhodothermus marinus TaxID=29549 RepID=A0A7V2F774_RHOMR|nr:Putative 3-methyladenine DNA glycosylase [bacterium HR18]
MERLSDTFFARPTLEVARDLLGRWLVHEHPCGVRLVGRIVETEAYRQDDPAFHGWRLVDPETGQVRPQGRAYDLFAPPGTAYVYLNYGMYWLLNVVTEPEGVGGAVLIRAVEPLEGLTFMQKQRPRARRPHELTGGPGRLTMAFDIDGRYHRRPLTCPPLYFAAGEPVSDALVATSGRIGLSRGNDLPWRFFVRNSPYVSPAFRV